jgi:hypothetical protein
MPRPPPAGTLSACFAVMAHSDNRRRFLHQATWIFASIPLASVAGSVLSACTKSPNPADSGGVKNPQSKIPDGQRPVDENEPVAVSLGYKQSADKVDTAKFPKRAGDEGKKQTCENCQFYNNVSDPWGSCQVIRSGLVNKGGWCNSWAAKPA